MRISDLKEAPVISVQSRDHRDPDDEGSAYPPIDKSKITSQKWLDSLVGKWKDSHKFKLVFIDHSMNSIEEPYNSMNELGAHISAESGVITVIYLGNEDPKDPLYASSIYLTPWMLAHRVFHALAVSKPTQKAVKKFEKNLFDALVPVSGVEEEGEPIVYSQRSLFDLIDFMHLETLLTTKGSKKLLDSYEIIPELVAQKIVTGRITLEQSDDPEISILSREIDRAVTQLLDAAVGKVIGY